jgi:2,4-dienoyl-CoA reductase-like NADH-dependent reductase (Old Yellow Enzyme family)
MLVEAHVFTQTSRFRSLMTQPTLPVPNLFDSFRLGSLQVPNRAVLAPMTRISAHNDGRASDRMRDYYRVFAKGQFGMIITEGSYIDKAHSQAYLNQPGLAGSEHISAWRSVTTAVHEEGAAIVAQLQHAGPQSQGNSHTQGLRSPSAVRAKGEQAAMYRGSGPYDLPQALTLDEIANIRRSFARSAARAQEAGFDGVEIHGANGYLIDAFLTDYLNERTDAFGGSAEARVQFASDIVTEVRAEVGDDFVVGIRISQGKVSDPTHKWPGGVSDAEATFGALNTSGVNYIHTTEWRASEAAFPGLDPRSLTSLARDFAPDVAIIANGHIDTLADADHMLESGATDLVAIGKAALANRDWPAAARSGRPLEAPLAPSAFGDLATVQDWEINSNGRPGIAA